jgi:hypothetical protein
MQTNKSRPKLYAVEGTSDILNELANADGRVTAVSLTRNFSHQAAAAVGLQ